MTLEVYKGYDSNTNDDDQEDIVIGKDDMKKHCGMLDMLSGELLFRKSSMRQSRGVIGFGREALQRMIDDPSSIDQILMDTFPDVFSETIDPGIFQDPKRKVTLKLKPGKTPVRSRALPLSGVQREELKAMLLKLIADKRLERCVSAWASPVFLVPKAGGKWRLVVDLRKVNDAVEPVQSALPRIDDLLANLYDCRYFSKLDLVDGYWQMVLDEDSSNICCITTPLGTYRWKVLPQGLHNASSLFQTYMEDIFAGVPYIIIFQDDLIIGTPSKKLHFAILHKVLEIMKIHKLRVKISKAEFCKPVIDALGYKIGYQMVRPGGDNMKKILNFPRPTSRGTVKQYLGLVRFFQSMIGNFAVLVRPIQRLLKEGVSFQWTTLQQEAFDQIGKALAVGGVYIPHPLRPFSLYTDASTFAMGGVLVQDGYPVSFFTRSMNSAELNYSVTMLETMSAFTAIDHFRRYLAGGTVTVYTDHEPLSKIMTKETLSKQEIHWMEKTSDIRKHFVYLKGSCNTVADYLSRRRSVVLDVCTGIGSTLQAIVQLGDLDTNISYLACEIDPDLREQITTNWQWSYSHSNHILQDKRLLSLPQDIHDLAKKNSLPAVHFFIAGIPCPPYSRAGPGTGKDHPQNCTDSILNLLERIHAQMLRQGITLEFVLECTTFQTHLLPEQEAITQRVSALGGAMYHFNMSNWSGQLTRERIIWSNIDLHELEPCPHDIMWQDCLVGATPPDNKTKSPTVMASHPTRNTLQSMVVDNNTQQKRCMTIEEISKLQGLAPHMTSTLSEQASRHAIGNAIPVPFIVAVLQRSHLCKKWPTKTLYNEIQYPMKPIEDPLRSPINNWGSTKQLIKRVEKHLEGKIDVDLAASPQHHVCPEWTSNALEYLSSLDNKEDIQERKSLRYYLNPPFTPKPEAQEFISEVLRKALEIGITHLAVVLPSWLVTNQIEAITIVREEIERSSPLFKNHPSFDPTTQWTVKILSLCTTADNKRVRFHQASIDMTAHYNTYKKLELEEHELQALIKTVHDNMHLSAKKMLSFLKHYVNLETLEEKAMEMAKEAHASCGVCKLGTKPHAGSIYKPYLSTHVYDTLVLDWVSMPDAKGRHKIDYNRFLLFTEKFSRFVIAIPCHTNDKTRDLIEQYMSHVYPIVGVPSRITGDQDVLTTSEEWKDFVAALGSYSGHTTSFNPRSNGRAELSNKFILGNIKKIIQAYDDWPRLLPIATATYNHSPFLIKGMEHLTPYQILYCIPPMPIAVSRSLSQNHLQQLTPVENTQEVTVQKWQKIHREVQRASTALATKLHQQRDKVQFKLGDTISFVLFRNEKERPKLCMSLRGPATVVKVSPSGGAVILRWTDPTSNTTYELDRSIRYCFPWKGNATDTRGLDKLPHEPMKETLRPSSANQKQILKRIWSHLPRKKRTVRSTRKREYLIPPFYLVKLHDGKIHEVSEDEVNKELLFTQKKFVEVGYPTSKLVEHHTAAWCHKTLLEKDVLPTYYKENGVTHLSKTCRQFLTENTEYTIT